jgi:hypothetical protein
MIMIFDYLATELRFYGQNGETKFDHDHSQNSKISVVTMANPNLIMTITTVQVFLLLKLLKYLF